MRHLLLAACAAALTSCSSFLPPPRTAGEFFSGYSYVPLDPLPVTIVDGPNCGPGHPHRPLLDDLPDNVVRIAVRKVDGSGKLGIGPAQLGYQGNSYQVILDYVNIDVANIEFRYSGQSPANGGRPTMLRRVEENEPAGLRGQSGEGVIIIPVYVGLGARLTADVTVHKGSVNLSGLGSLMAAADAQRISGSLVVQTLGVTGPKIVATLPLPNKIDQTTIENSILALGAIKALIGDQTSKLTARVTGIYNPIKDADQDTIHRIVSQLADGRSSVQWKRDCP